MYGRSLKWRRNNEDRIRREKLYKYRKELCRTLSSRNSDESKIRFLQRKIRNIEKQL